MIITVVLLVVAELVGQAAAGESLFAWMDENVVPAVGTWLQGATRALGIESLVDWLLRALGATSSSSSVVPGGGMGSAGTTGGFGDGIGEHRASSSFGYLPGRGMVRGDGSVDDEEWREFELRSEEL